MRKDDKEFLFWRSLDEIRMMIRVIMSDPTPIMKQPDILKKTKIINYALNEWNDEFERRYGYEFDTKHNTLNETVKEFEIFYNKRNRK